MWVQKLISRKVIDIQNSNFNFGDFSGRVRAYIFGFGPKISARL